MLDQRSRPEPDPEAPSSDELIRRAVSLVPLLRENETEAERLCHLPDASVKALEDAGLFRMLQPADRGGYGAGPATISKVLTTIASGSASTIWVMTIYGSVGQLTELLPEDALAEIYAGPHSKIAGVFGKVGATVERVNGGFLARDGGRWPFNSGCRHATWDLLRLTVKEPDGSTWPAFGAVPMSDLTILDDWNVMGARGTGSNTVICGELFIPAHRVAGVPKDVRTVLRPELAAAQSWTIPLGMARHALEVFVDLARTRGINHLGYARMGDAPIVQTAVAAASVDIKLIETYQEWVLSGLSDGRAVAPEDAAIQAIGPVRCFELARQLIERLFALCPSTEIQLTTPIQRLLRDMHVFEHQHAMTPFIGYEQFGRRFFAS